MAQNVFRSAFIAVQGLLVGKDELPNCFVMSLAEVEQFFARGELIGNGVIYLGGGYAGGNLIAFGDFRIELGAGEDKAAAHREVLFLFCEEVAAVIPGAKNHAIRVLGQRFIIKDNLIVHRAPGARNSSLAGDKAACVRFGVDRHA